MATKTIAWQTGSGNITLTYTGQGDGPISVATDVNNGSARSQTITIQTTKGGLITKNVTVSQAACPIPVGAVLNYSYTGNYQEVTLPAGQYKLQCWGAQGGSNAAASSYSITAKAGGKGGYSEGVITLSSPTTVRVYVGGAGSSSAGGFNGGGSTTGSSSYSTGTSGQAGYHFGTSRMGGGGGATDIRLSDGALLSRMIVAGGGSGGAMCYKKEITSTTTWESCGSTSDTKTGSYTSSWSGWTHAVGGKVYVHQFYYPASQFSSGDKIKIDYTCSLNYETGVTFVNSAKDTNVLNVLSLGAYNTTSRTATIGTIPSTAAYLCVQINHDVNEIPSYNLQKEVTSTSTTTYNDYQTGFAGGGTIGISFNTTAGYNGKQNAAGVNASFGQGANQTTTNYRYCPGAGGGGWYGGGSNSNSDTDTTYVRHMGGGSGFVNTSASASNRPSSYTGLQLDSGTTYAGNTSFPAPGGGTETGHAGNGYARITRIS